MTALVSRLCHTRHKMSSRTRAFCWTLNNYTPEDLEKLSSCFGKYTVFGKETGASGTPHLQGFTYFPNGKTLSAVKAYLPPGAHIEVMKGTLEQAIAYCQKDGDYTELGEKPLMPKEKGGKEKERWAVALAQAKATGEVEDPQIALMHCRNIDYVHGKELLKKVRMDTEAKMLWYWGPTGTGKSRKARQDNPGAYLKMCNKWWDGYAEEEVAIMEDFDKTHHVLCHHLKIWADRYEFLCEHKGGGRRIRPRLLIVTSNYHPSQIWSEREDLEPILRRFHCVEFPLEEEEE